jgi:3-oxoacyl-[acyl-carrier-protein] synthase II
MRRVVVTGLGAVTPLGNDVASTWEALVQGRSGIERITLFDPSPFEVQIGGEVKEFHPEEHIPPKELRRMDRNVQMGVVAALQSVRDAGLRLGDGDNGRRAGVIFASGIGGAATMLEQQKILQERGPRRVSPFFLANMLADSASGHIAIMLGATGPNMAVVSSCSTGTGSIGEAMETIRRGDADVVVSGATEATILPLFMAGFQALRALAGNNSDPHKACKPFDLRRDGFVVGEGAAALVLETLEHAQARGARIYAEVIGYGASNDAYDMVASEESGRGPINSMELALAKAGVDREEVGYINAHGTGTLMNDRVETAAIKSVFGEHAYRLAVSSTKSMTGHLMGAAGALEALATVLALHNQTIPPTINYEVPDPDCDLDYVPNAARPAALRVAMSNSIGLGGHCACVLFRQYPS